MRYGFCMPAAMNKIGERSEGQAQTIGMSIYLHIAILPTSDIQVKTKVCEDATTEGQRTLCGFRAVYIFDRLSRDLWPSLCAFDVIRDHF